MQLWNMVHLNKQNSSAIKNYCGLKRRYIAAHWLKSDLKIFMCRSFPQAIVFEKVDAIIMNESVIKFYGLWIISNEIVLTC